MYSVCQGIKGLFIPINGVDTRVLGLWLMDHRDPAPLSQRGLNGMLMFLQKAEYLVVVGVGIGMELKLTGTETSWS